MAGQKLIFLHIPKTAGSTFDNFLRNYFYEKEIIEVTWKSWFNGCNDLLTKKHLNNKISLVTGHQPFGNHVYLQGNWVYVTFLRDPVERTFSHYYFLTKDASYAKLAEILNSPGFMWKHIPMFKLFDNFQTRFLSNNIFGVEYASMSEMCSCAIQNLKGMHVGLTERFDDSLMYFANLLSPPPHPSLLCLPFIRAKRSVGVAPFTHQKYSTRYLPRISMMQFSINMRK